MVEMEGEECGVDAKALCTFFLRGLCTKGSVCTFSHACEEGCMRNTLSTNKKRKRKKEAGAENKQEKEKEKEKEEQMLCGDCQQSFIFTTKNQAYYKLKGYEPPQRCRTCREYRGSKQ